MSYTTVFLGRSPLHINMQKGFSANFFHGENMSECCNNGIESLTSLLGPPGLSELLSQISVNDPFFLTVRMTDLWLWKNGLDAH